MKISIEQLLRTGEISPFWWGMSVVELRPLLAGNPEYHWGTGRIGWQCLLDVDGVEFHFQARREHLWLLVLKAWRLPADTVSSCFDFGWINENVTLKRMRRELDHRGWPYEVMHDPINPDHPVLILHRRVWCFFEGEAAAPTLQKISLAAPDVDPELRHYARLVPIPT